MHQLRHFKKDIASILDYDLIHMVCMYSIIEWLDFVGQHPWLDVSFFIYWFIKYKMEIDTMWNYWRYARAFTTFHCKEICINLATSFTYKTCEPEISHKNWIIHAYTV